MIHKQSTDSLGMVCQCQLFVAGPAEVGYNPYVLPVVEQRDDCIVEYMLASIAVRWHTWQLQ